MEWATWPRHAGELPKNQAFTGSDSQTCPKLASRCGTRVPLLTPFTDFAQIWSLSLCCSIQEAFSLSQMHRVGGSVHTREGLKPSSMGTSLPAGWVSTCPRMERSALSICNTEMRSSLCKDSPARQSQTADLSLEGFGEACGWGMGTCSELTSSPRWHHCKLLGTGTWVPCRASTPSWPAFRDWLVCGPWWIEQVWKTLWWLLVAMTAEQTVSS